MLVVERFKNGAWEEAGRGLAGDVPGSMSDNGDEGSRQLIFSQRRCTPSLGVTAAHTG